MVVSTEDVIMDSKMTTSWDDGVESNFKIPNFELARRMN